MSTILDRIAGRRRERIEAEERALPLSALKSEVRTLPPARDVLGILRRWPADRRAVIAEIKRRSPSKGELAPNLDPALLAAAYQRAGAFAVSCLVEPDFFGGGLNDFDAARSVLSIPLLYKDFVVSPYQVHQARCHGADLVLLIAGLLGQELAFYLEEVREAGLTALVEVHDGEELELALGAGAVLVGVNNRNLKTFVTDLSVSEELIPRLGQGILAVSESGISTALEMDRLSAAGARAFLIGESLVKSSDPERELRKFVLRDAP